MLQEDTDQIPKRRKQNNELHHLGRDIRTQLGATAVSMLTNPGRSNAQAQRPTHNLAELTTHHPSEPSSILGEDLHHQDDVGDDDKLADALQEVDKSITPHSDSPDNAALMLFIKLVHQKTLQRYQVSKSAIVGKALSHVKSLLADDMVIHNGFPEHTEAQRLQKIRDLYKEYRSLLMLNSGANSCRKPKWKTSGPSATTVPGKGESVEEEREFETKLKVMVDVWNSDEPAISKGVCFPVVRSLQKFSTLRTTNGVANNLYQLFLRFKTIALRVRAIEETLHAQGDGGFKVVTRWLIQHKVYTPTALIRKSKKEFWQIIEKERYLRVSRPPAVADSSKVIPRPTTYGGESQPLRFNLETVHADRFPGSMSSDSAPGANSSQMDAVLRLLQAQHTQLQQQSKQLRELQTRSEALESLVSRMRSDQLSFLKHVADQSKSSDRHGSI